MNKLIKICIILLLCLAALLSGCSRTVTNSTTTAPVPEVIEQTHSTPDAELPKVTEATQEQSMQPGEIDSEQFETVTEQVYTENQKMSGQIIHLDGEDFDTLRFVSEDGVNTYIVLEGAYQVLDMEWINDDSYFCIMSHINPSMELYTVVDIKDDYTTLNYYGFGFTWNADWSNLYYIEAAPHFSDDTTDKLVDIHHNILYQTEEGSRFIGSVLVTPNEKHLACEVATVKETTELYVFEKKSVDAAALVGILADYSGVPSFTDNETIAITDDTGASIDMKISDLDQ